MPLDQLALVGIDGVERVRAEEVVDLGSARNRTGRSWLDPGFDERGAQPEHAGADPALDGAFGLLEQHRDLAVRVTAEVRELDRDALGLGQRRERAPHRLGFVEVDDLALEIDRLGDPLAPRAPRAGGGAVSARRRSTLRPWACAIRNDRSEPRSGS